MARIGVTEMTAVTIMMTVTIMMMVVAMVMMIGRNDAIKCKLSDRALLLSQRPAQGLQHNIWWRNEYKYKYNQSTNTFTKVQEEFWTKPRNVRFKLRWP